jgi:hypothetical protein
MSKRIAKVFPTNVLSEGNSALIGNINTELNPQGIQIFYLDGRDVCDKQSFLSKIATVMKFPDYFGYNWDAFDECITDLDWFSAERYVLIYDQPEVFSKAAPKEWETAYSLLQAAVAYWQSTDKPMDILFIGDQ